MTLYQPQKLHRFAFPVLMAAGLLLSGCNESIEPVQEDEWRITVDLDLEEPIYELDYQTDSQVGGVRNANKSLLQSGEDIVWDFQMQELNLDEESRETVNILFQFTVLPTAPDQESPEQEQPIEVTPALELPVKAGSEVHLKLTCTKDMACTIEKTS